MHRALFISEVVHTIASHHLEKRDLAVLAQTCHTFSEPALDALWSNLADLTPLLQCLPKDLISCGETSLVSSGVYSLRRPFTTADWAIFRKNAARVKVLDSIVPEDESDGGSNGSDWVDVISDEVFHALSLPPISETLFPKLRKLVWRDVQPEGFSFLELLLGPSITSLEVYPHSSSTRVLRLAAQLGVLCPHVRSFTWMFSGQLDTSAAKAMSTLSQAVVSWHNLKYVVCHHLSPEAIQHLSSLPSLRVLITTANDTTYPALHAPAFPHTNQLVLWNPFGHPLSDVVPLVCAGHSYPVEFGTGTDTASTASIHDLFKALSNHLDLTTLKILKIDERDARPDFVLSKSALEHIFPFRNLLTVHLDTRREVDLDDAALLAMAGAWPQLVSLQINENWGWRRLSGVTLCGVRAVLQRLPRLAELSVAVDCETATHDPLGDDGYGQFKVERPFEMNFLDSRIGEEYVEVAAFLSDLFPEIARNFDIYSWGWRYDEGPMVGYNIVDRWQYSERWMNVANTVVMMNRIRKREKGPVVTVAE